MDWKTQLNETERTRLEELAGERKRNIAEYRRIYDRCRKRLRAKGSMQ